MTVTIEVFDEQMRRQAGGEWDSGLLRRVGASWSGVLWSDLDEANAADVVEAQVRYFAGLGVAFEWKFYTHDRPGTLPELLRTAGLVAGEEEAVMVADVADLSLDVALPDGVRIVPVTDDEGVNRMVEVHDTVFGGDQSALGRALSAQLRTDPESTAPIVVMAGDRAVCAARTEYRAGTDFASLWGGGTLPEWRGKGIYRATVAYRARLAAERGVRYLHVDASADSRPILQRLGFTRLTTTIPYTMAPQPKS